jgi:alpha,alpha-trehalase
MQEYFIKISFIMSTRIKAAIFDLDGVITDTANTHAKAWKLMFDQYNERRQNEGKEPYETFTIENDYIQYVDGKPRYMGVKDFLSSRNIELPFGNPEDTPDMETVCGLGNMKNKMFLETVKNEGVEILEENVRKAKEWKKAGIRTAIVSSSKNCRMILQAVHLEDLFETRIDGLISAEKNYKGKPAPDIFVKAAENLGIAPADALIVEDALAGVEAGRNGRFGLVIGIAKEEQEEEMKQYGADIVVENLAHLPVNIVRLRAPEKLNSALAYFKEIRQQYKDHDVYLFLDYDGTLTPIVEDYKAAFLSDDMRDLIRSFSKIRPTAVITGRDLQDIRELVKLDELHYAGSHGFELIGPDGFIFENEEAKKSLKKIAEAADRIKEATSLIDGIKFERKKFALAVHYRQVAEHLESKVKKIVYDIIDQYPEIKSGKGKKVIELKPNFDWHKGKSLRILLERMLRNTSNEAFIFYIGDDITDEDAFFEVLDDGTGILVGDHGQKTYAGYHLNDVDEVKIFLIKLFEDLKG